MIMMQGKKYTVAQGVLAPEMPKRAPASHKKAPPPQICIEFNAKQNWKKVTLMQASLKSSPQIFVNIFFPVMMVI